MASRGAERITFQLAKYRKVPGTGGGFLGGRLPTDNRSVATISMEDLGMVKRMSDQVGDGSLGLTSGICRRDFLNGTLLAAGGALLGPDSPAQLFAQSGGWGGYTGEGDYQNSNGNTEEVMRIGHSVRDGAFDKLPADVIDTREQFDCVVVGGGISGLAAALYFHDQAVGSGRTCLVIENHPIFGGEAKRNEFIVDGQRLIGPQGSNLWTAPLEGSTIAQLYERIGLDWRSVRYQTWAGPGPEMPLSMSSYSKWQSMPATYGFYFGAKFGQRPGIWVRDIWNNLDATLPGLRPRRSAQMEEGKSSPRKFVDQREGGSRPHSR